MNNHLGRIRFEAKITKELKELQRRLEILNQGRNDNGGGDCFLPGHMVYLIPKNEKV